MDPRRRHSVDYPVSRTLVGLRRVRSLKDPSTISMSMHCSDFPISRTLVALKRVRSLRDPSTNSMSMNWETRSIYLGSENGCHAGACDDNLQGLTTPCMPMMNKQPDPCRTLCRSVKTPINSTPQQSSFVDYSDGNRLKHEMDRGICSCWSRTPKTRPSMEKWPLLDDHQHISESRVPNCMQTRRIPCQKFMPKSFKEVVGQDGVTRSLTIAISTGRIASLYLFHGPRGTGKTSAARVFAAALNCISSEIDKPCGVCEDCVSNFCKTSWDIEEVHSVTINSVKKFRALMKNANAHPYSGYKVYIIDECHLLLGEIWNSILNNLEELPRHVFVMVTPDLDKVPSIAVSKSQRYRFRLVEEVEIAKRLQKVCADEGLEFDEDALKLIATKSNGSLRDAVMTLDHLSLLGRKITLPLVYEVNGAVCDDELLNLLETAMSSDASSTVKKARELMRSRIDPLQLISQLANLIMDILAGKCGEGDSEIRRSFFAEADRQQLSRALKILSETEKQLRMSKNQTTWLTVALLQLGSALPQDDESKHPMTRACVEAVSGDTGILNDAETIWKRATEICNPSSLKKFLQRRGKLASVLLTSGIVVAELEFDRPDSASRAEKSWKVIAAALHNTLGYNVELRIKVANNASDDHAKLKKLSFRLFSCSRRLNFRPQYCIECRSDASESSKTSTGRGSQDEHRCWCTNETVASIRNSNGNSLSIRLLQDMHSCRKRHNCWRSAFRRALIEKKLFRCHDRTRFGKLRAGN